MSLSVIQKHGTTPCKSNSVEIMTGKIRSAPFPVALISDKIRKLWENYNKNDTAYSVSGLCFDHVFLVVLPAWANKPQTFVSPSTITDHVQNDGWSTALRTSNSNTQSHKHKISCSKRLKTFLVRPRVLYPVRKATCPLHSENGKGITKIRLHLNEHTPHVLGSNTPYK